MRRSDQGRRGKKSVSGLATHFKFSVSGAQLWLALITEHLVGEKRLSLIVNTNLSQLNGAKLKFHVR